MTPEFCPLRRKILRRVVLRRVIQCTTLSSQPSHLFNQIRYGSLATGEVKEKWISAFKGKPARHIAFLPAIHCALALAYRPNNRHLADPVSRQQHNPRSPDQLLRRQSPDPLASTHDTEPTLTPHVGGKRFSNAHLCRAECEVRFNASLFLTDD